VQNRRRTFEIWQHIGDCAARSSACVESCSSDSRKKVQISSSRRNSLSSLRAAIRLLRVSMPVESSSVKCSCKYSIALLGERSMRRRICSCTSSLSCVFDVNVVAQEHRARTSSM
jgi:hypothetical protein